MHGKRPLRQASVSVGGGVVMGKRKGVGGVGWVYRHRRGQKTEYKTDRLIFFNLFYGEGPNLRHDITLHILHE